LSKARAVEEVGPAVGGVVAVGVGVHGVEVLRQLIEVYDGVERDGIIPPQFLVIFCLVFVESFLVAEFSQQHMPTHNAGDWARGRAGGGAEALQRRTALRGGTELSGSGIYHPRVATRRGRLGNVRKGKEGFHLRMSIHSAGGWARERAGGGRRGSPASHRSRAGGGAEALQRRTALRDVP
jgi:hypothetical protein